MKRYSIIAVATMLVLLSASASLAIFPAAPDGTATIKLQQGLFLGKPAWYICTDTNDIRTAASQYMRWCQPLNLAPKLSSLLGSKKNFSGAPDLYIVTNPPSTQGPVFSTAPELPLYSGKWRIVFITFKKPCYSRHVTSALPAVPKLNPYGLPSDKEAWFEKSDIVVDYPIVAIGHLGSPAQVWYNLQGGFTYRLGSAKNINSGAKTITLPTYFAYVQNPITYDIKLAEFIITETTDRSDANYFGWSYAPGLKEIPWTDTMKLWAFGFSRVPLKSGHFPVLQASPIPLGPKNRNYDYSPIMDGFLIFGGNPGSSLNNPQIIEQLLRNNVIYEEFVERLNGSVIGYVQ